MAKRYPFTMKCMSTIRPDTGFSLISAIFLLVVLSALGTFMLMFSSAQQIGMVQDLEGSRAYQAARAGVEWGLYQVSHTSLCPATTHLNFDSATGLAAFTSSVSCTQDGPYTEGGSSISVYRLTANACNRPASGACPGGAGSLSYAERQVQAVVSR